MKKIYFSKILFAGLCLGIIGVLISFNACNRDDIEFEKPEQMQSRLSQQDGDIIKLGKKLENPYTVENMRKAYENLHENKQLKSSMSIEATHYYVKFLPDNEEQRDLLLSDSLELFDYPLDYEVEEGGVFYQDPSIPDSLITWQYTAVPVDYEFPDVKYEILANLYMQEENDDLTELKSSSVGFEDWAMLEDEALKITGNFDEEDETEAKSSLKGRKWRPSGCIKVNDDYMGDIPLWGVRVVVKRWFKWKHAITDKNGRFSTGRFRSKRVKYGIKWQRADFDIRSGSYGQAWYNFVKKKKRAWNLTIKKSSTPKSWLYAHIHRAAMVYFYENYKWGIQKPYDKNRKLKRRLHIAGKNKAGRAHYYTFNRIVWSAPVVVYSKTKGGINLKSRGVFGTTIHELAHVSHWRIGYNTASYVVKWIFSDPVLPESWAVGVEWKITNDVYPYSKFGIYENRYQSKTINWILNNDGYTPLVIDLIDNVNQRTEQGGSTSYPNDQVSGYTLKQLEASLKKASYSLDGWKDEIKSMHYNSTKAHVDYLFNTYNN